MRTEQEIRQTIDWLHHAISIHCGTDKETRYIVGGIQGQIDVLLWALGEPNNWDCVYAAMALRHAGADSRN